MSYIKTSISSFVALKFIMVFNQNIELICSKEFWTSGFVWWRSQGGRWLAYFSPTLPAILVPLERFEDRDSFMGVWPVVVQAPWATGPCVWFNVLLYLESLTFWKRDPTFSFCTGPCKFYSWRCLRICQKWLLLELKLRAKLRRVMCGMGKKWVGG